MTKIYELSIEWSEGKYTSRSSFEKADLGYMLVEAEDAVMRYGALHSTVSIDGEIYCEFEL